MMNSKKRINLILVLSFILIFSLLPIPHVRAGWLDGWDQRVKITIDHDDIDTDLTNFPVLIYISSSSGINNEDITFIFDEVGANSLKIAITESDGTTECKVEVERWDNDNEKAWLWTKFPSISSGVDTDIYFYFDNDHADNVANVGATGSAPAQAVWDDDFAAVWHMGSGAGNEVDSTGNGHTLTEFGQIDQIAGQIGYARDFLGSADYFEYADADLGIGAGPFTVEKWFLNDADDGRLLYTYNPTSGIFTSTKNPLGGSFDVSGTIFVAGASVEIQSAGDRPYNDDTWYYMVYTRDNADDLELLMDNVQVDTGIKAGSIDGGGHGHVGAAFNHGAEFDGIIEELRVSTVFRSPSWKKASYESGRDDLLDWGLEEKIKPPSDPNLLFGAGFNDSSPYVELHWNHSLENVQFFEVQNSSDGISWDYLGQTTTANYTDSQVINGTERYYRIRACNQTGGAWYNSSFTTINFEKVYFITGVVANGIITEESFFWIPIAIVLSIIAGLLVWLQYEHK